MYYELGVGWGAVLSVSICTCVLFWLLKSCTTTVGLLLRLLLGLVWSAVAVKLCSAVCQMSGVEIVVTVVHRVLRRQKNTG